MRKYETRYYTLYSDLDVETVREAALRVTRMAQHYHDRVKGLGRTIRRRLPFYLFRRKADYRAAGGLPGSAGLYAGDRLMALASGSNVWHVVQHEGFHQFVHRAIGGRMPIWLNEGLAEYFGHAEWTGDDFISGAIPRSFKSRVDRLIRQGRLKPFGKMLTMTNQEWSARLDRANYDQAWAMVHFLIHAENGKYRDALGKMISDISRGADPTKSFQVRITRNVDGFQEHFSKWWLSLPARPTAQLEDEILVRTLTSFLARAHVLGLRFQDSDAFFAQAKAGKIRVDVKRQPDLWLPQSLLQRVLKPAGRLKGWQLDTTGRLPRLRLRRPDGTVLVGSFLLRNRDEVKVELEVVKPAVKNPAADKAGR
jgi:hypothetical protein